jgi:glycosyltransferase involved in cell wall biosynthesis
MRFAGIKQNKICIVSNSSFACPDYSVVAIPDELEPISSTELINDFRLRDGYFISSRGKKCASDIKLALIANYGDTCGIATYSKFLFEELVKLVPDYRIFAEKNDNPDLGGSNITRDKIEFCWKRGESLAELAKEVAKYDPDIVLIQHEFGIFPNARHWLSLLTQLSTYRVIVELHSTFPNHQDKIIFEAAIEEAIVHLQAAQNNIENEKKLSTKVHTIGHSCYSVVDQKKLWNNYKSEHTFVQVGFGFKYKNFEDGIKATATLKEKYQDVFFTILFSESPHNKSNHQYYYNELISLIDKLDVSNNVAIVRGFQSDNTINNYFRSNQVAIFPYLSMPGHEVFGSSGAVRLAFSAGVPTITSTLPHFSDTPSVKANGANQIAEELDKFFTSKTKRVEQIEKQNQFARANSWENTAKKYVAIFEEPVK